MELVLECGKEFHGAMVEKGVDTKFSREHLYEMILSEVEEHKVAKDEAEKIDAHLDIAFYCANSLARPGATEADDFWVRAIIVSQLDRIREYGIDPEPLIRIVHAANMTKFTLPGGRLENGKWMKPPGFKAPDDDLRAEIQWQRSS